MSTVRPVVDIVRAWADREPDRICLTFHRTETESDAVTYAALDRESEGWARQFIDSGLEPGSPLVLLAPSDRRCVSAFLGAQRAGLLAIPTAPAEPLEGARRVGERIGDILTQSGARVVVSPVPGAADGVLRAALEARGAVLVTAPPTEQMGSMGQGAPLPSRHPRFAYCQFTSGSGGRAKGVLVTHSNLLAYMHARRLAYEITDADVQVAWLPLFHDNGLVAYALSALITGVPSHLMAPVSFLTRPVSWLRLITRVRGTFSTAPNFGYALCVRRVTDDDMAGLDLTSWRCAACGAEPITREVVEAFTRRFAPVGFRASALIPAYGLAENTLAATGRRPGEGPLFDEVSREALEREGRAIPAHPGQPVTSVPSVGRPLPGQEILIRGSDGAPLPDREIGEVVLRGATVMHGYLPGTEAEPPVGPDGWLMTGDLGYLAGGELFIVGRKKDLIIRAGRKYFPQDIEHAAAQVPGTRAGRVVAFSVPGVEREGVVLVAERREDDATDPGALRAAIAAAVFETARFVPDEIRLVPPRGLPVTTSGKVMRPEARRLFLEGVWPGP